MIEGVAIAHIKFISSLTDNNAQPGSGLPGAHGNAKTTKTKLGWNLGVGGEYFINDVWAIKIEYLYSDFGKLSTTYTLIPTPALSEFSSSLSSTVDFNTQRLLVGMVFEFT